VSTAAASSGEPTPAEALPQPLPESLSPPREENATNLRQPDSVQAAPPATSSAVARRRRYDLSFLAVLAGVQVAWLALLAFAILAFLR
jgi:hypothetical protein